jgi:hypothetical protein
VPQRMMGGRFDLGPSRIPQDLLQPLVLRTNSVYEKPLRGEAHPFKPGWYVLYFRGKREDVIDIYLRREGTEPRPDTFNAFTEGAARKDHDLVAVGEQDTPNGEQRVQVARRRRRGEKNFHEILSSLFAKQHGQGQVGWWAKAQKELRDRGYASTSDWGTLITVAIMAGSTAARNEKGLHTSCELVALRYRGN